MCGFVGYVNLIDSNLDQASIIKSMTDQIIHRGPDDDGIWLSLDRKVILGHRRLSIIDLSDSGHQPMVSEDQNLIIVFNGEIYNHLEIRSKLSSEGISMQWRGHSDTETLLAALDFWGVRRTLEECIGMFAFALYNINDGTITLARDRFGEKPLYFGWIEGAFVFASELKAIQAHPNFKNNISKKSLSQYLKFSYVPAPSSIFENILKLEPGKYIQEKISTLSNKACKQRVYWSLSSVIEKGHKDLIHDDVEAVNQMEAALQSSVKMQMLSDVPLGAFLSGGVDSSSIVALMQKDSMKPIQTFTIGFEDSQYDESPYAKDVAEHLGTEHNEYIVTHQETMETIPLLPHMYDEPFADPSQIPTYLVSQAAKRKVTVALSGDGGDEIFGGYNRYFWGPNIWNKISWLPFSSRKILAKLVLSIPVSGWSAIGKINNMLRPGVAGIAALGDKAHKLSDRLRKVHNIDDLYLSLVTEWQDPSLLIQDFSQEKDFQPSFEIFSQTPEVLATSDASSRMMFWDSLSYLPDDILCKVDRAAMASSLETRVPFLDHRIAELAWKLPLNMKIREDESKWILRSILYKYVPKNLIERPKAGFGIPVGDWLRGPLKEWAEDLLNKDRLKSEGYLKPDLINKIWLEHLSGNYDWTPRLWSVLMFQSWLENQK